VFRNRRFFREHRQIRLDYPASARPGPRWGHGSPVHEGIRQVLAASRARQEELLESLHPHLDAYLALPHGPSAVPPDPDIGSEWFGSLDGFLLYALIASRRPRRFLEIGSGNSTRVAAAARRDGGFAMEITSIDPEPRSDVESLIDRSVRAAFEVVDLASLPTLEAGDVLFLDGSHRCFQNSDVTAFFLDVLPATAPGVLVHVHDIFWPLDYPPDWVGRWYSEQYVLGAMPVGGAALDVLLPAYWFVADPDRPPQLDPLRDGLSRLGLPFRGHSFWFTRTGA
jgi:predicted O-methyltransferase YrrM